MCHSIVTFCGLKNKLRTCGSINVVLYCIFETKLPICTANMFSDVCYITWKGSILKYLSLWTKNNFHNLSYIGWNCRYILWKFLNVIICQRQIKKHNIVYNCTEMFYCSRNHGYEHWLVIGNMKLKYEEDTKWKWSDLRYGVLFISFQHINIDTEYIGNKKSRHVTFHI